MNADRTVPPAPAPAPQQDADADLKALCEKIRKEVTLTPPGIIDALCGDAPPRPICPEAIYVEELQELARKLNRGLTFDFDRC